MELLFNCSIILKKFALVNVLDCCINIDLKCRAEGSRKEKNTNRKKVISTGASDRRFYPIFNKGFDHLETQKYRLLIIQRSKNVLSAGSLCGPLVPSP